MRRRRLAAPVLYPKPAMRTTGPACCARRARCAAPWASATSPRWARSTCRAATRQSSSIGSTPIRCPRLPVGRARYGLMLREDGIVFDDGTVSRLAPDHFFVTTTTANADPVMAHLDFHLQTGWPELDVQFGLGDRRIGVDVGRRAAGARHAAASGRRPRPGERRLPLHGGRRSGDRAAVPVRVFRISFSGELAYEVATPWGYGQAVWEAILQAGRCVRHPALWSGSARPAADREGPCRGTGAERPDFTTAADLGLGRMLKPRGDFIGRALAGRPAWPIRTARAWSARSGPERNWRSSRRRASGRGAGFAREPWLGQQRYPIGRTGRWIGLALLQDAESGGSSTFGRFPAEGRERRGRRDEPRFRRSGERPCSRLTERRPNPRSP